MQGRDSACEWNSSKADSVQNTDAVKRLEFQVHAFKPMGAGGGGEQGWAAWTEAVAFSLVSLGLKICIPKTLLKIRDQLKRYLENRLKTWPGYIL